MRRSHGGVVVAVAAVGFLLAAAGLWGQEGDPDPSFGASGRVLVDWEQNAVAQALEPLADGGLLVAGSATDTNLWALVRLAADGAVAGAPFLFFDFGGDGSVDAYDVYDLSRDSTDRTLMAGWVDATVGSPRPALARLTAAGNFDGTFDGDGREMVTAVPAGWTLVNVTDAQIMKDQRSVFVGRCSNCLGAGVHGSFVLRLNAIGAPDPTFSDDGWLAFRIETPDLTNARAVSVADSGAITVAGFVQISVNTAVFVVRLTVSGQFDPDFGGGDGVAPLAEFAPGAPTDIAVDPDTGVIVLALAAIDSASVNGANLLAYTGAGLVMDTFGIDGYVDLELEEGTRLDAVEFQSDGKVAAVGTIDADGSQTAGFFLARTLADGTLDDSFDSNGVQRVEFDRTANAADRAWAATLSGGRLVAAGVARAAGLDDFFAVLRVDSALIFTDGFERQSTAAWED